MDPMTQQPTVGPGAAPYDPLGAAQLPIPVTDWLYQLSVKSQIPIAQLTSMLRTSPQTVIALSADFEVPPPEAANSIGETLTGAAPGVPPAADVMPTEAFGPPEPPLPQYPPAPRTVPSDMHPNIAGRPDVPIGSMPVAPLENLAGTSSTDTLGAGPVMKDTLAPSGPTPQSIGAALAGVKAPPQPQPQQVAGPPQPNAINPIELTALLKQLGLGPSSGNLSLQQAIGG